MKKKIAVLIRGRQEEGLRMSVGITLMNDIVDVYVLGSKVKDTEKNTLNLEAIRAVKMGLYTNCKDNEDMILLSDREIAGRLITYDHVIAY